MNTRTIRIPAPPRKRRNEHIAEELARLSAEIMRLTAMVKQMTQPEPFGDSEDVSDE